MSAIFEVNQTELEAVLNEFEILRKNVTSEMVPATQKFMGTIQDMAIDLTHFISHNLQSGWNITSSGTGNTMTVKLFNPVEYAAEEFSRPGVKESVGTEHDVRPAIQDATLADIETVVFNAMTKGLR